jgi:hypothetical protein
MLYDSKIRGLYQRIDELEKQIFKYRNIGENMDDNLSFSEAELIFEETMRARRRDVEEEYARGRRDNKNDRLAHLMPDDRKELKRLYRKLARSFHPDLTRGDDRMMIRINKAYDDGDLDTLRQFDLEYGKEEDISDPRERLSRKLDLLIQRIRMVKSDIRDIRSSEMYIMKRNFTKDVADPAVQIDAMAKKIRKEILRKEAYLEELKVRYGQTRNGS